MIPLINQPEGIEGETGRCLHSPVCRSDYYVQLNKILTSDILCGQYATHWQSSELGFFLLEIFSTAWSDGEIAFVVGSTNFTVANFFRRSSAEK